MEPDMRNLFLPGFGVTSGDARNAVLLSGGLIQSSAIASAKQGGPQGSRRQAGH